MLNYIRKIIIISGSGNTGKTTSIKASMKKLSVYNNHGYDCLIAAHAFNKGQFFATGFATGGDSEEVINENINYFKNISMEIDILVMACKSRGRSKDRLLEFVEEYKLEPFIIETHSNENYKEAAEQTSNRVVREFY